MSTPRVLLASGETLDVDISAVMDSAQLRVKVAEALHTVTSCFSLVQDGTILNGASIEDILLGGDITAIVNAEIHGLHEKWKRGLNHLQELEKKIKVNDENHKQTCDTMYGELHLQTDRTLGHLNDEIAGCEWDLQTSTMSLHREKQTVAYLQELRRKKTELSLRLEAFVENERALLKLRQEALSEAEGARKMLISLRPDSFWDDLRFPWEDSIRVWDYDDGMVDFDDDCFPIADSEDDMEQHQWENHARSRRFKKTAVKQTREPAARLRRSGKVRPRGGRHKVGESVDLEAEIEFPGRVTL